MACRRRRRHTLARRRERDAADERPIGALSRHRRGTNSRANNGEHNNNAQAIMEMKEGEARKLIIPADLGYGSKGAGGKIPGGATLYFEVKLAALGDAPVLNEKQQQWLDEHPI
jgi:hypothetical protein